MDSLMDDMFRVQAYIGIATAAWLIIPFLLKKLYQFTMFLLKSRRKWRASLARLASPAESIPPFEIDSGSPPV